MCEKCVNSVREHFPNLTDEEHGELLMSATSFPFGSFENVEKQIVELRDNSDGTLGGAISYATKKLDEQMEAFRKKPTNDPQTR